MASVDVRFGMLDAGEEEVARLAGLLDGTERARAARFRFAADRRRFVVRRGRLREWLGERVREAPRALRFVAGAAGKPALADGGPRFSLSHSGERMMLAIADVEVGCDIERMRADVEWRPIAERLFAPGERRALAALPEDAGRRGFFACWARKEAFVKALGQGLSWPLDAFEVSTGPLAKLISGGDGWEIATASPCPNYGGAVVAADDGRPLVVRSGGEGGRERSPGRALRPGPPSRPPL